MSANDDRRGAVAPARRSLLDDDDPWGGLRIPFLDRKTPTEKQRILGLSEGVARGLDEWAAGFPLVRRVRARPLALSVTAASPHSSESSLISTARLSLWVFTLDDVFDEQQFPERELLRRAERYRRIARGLIPSCEDDGLSRALIQVRDDLARYPLFASIGHDWANALCGTIDGMLAELRWRDAYRERADASLPSYQEYLEHGLYSIGAPPHMWGALITIGDRSTPEHLPRLREMERIASTCIRLANDLQSYAKEVEEGNVNALVLFGRQYQKQGLSAEAAHAAAEDRVRSDIARGLAELAELSTPPFTRTGEPEAAIADIAGFVCEFYRQYDYHTFDAARRSVEGA